MKKYKIREIEVRDNLAVEAVIRSCLIEYGANHDGTAWADPNLSRFSEIYSDYKNKYWVAEDENGNIIGGVGIGELSDLPGICELQKMYCLPEARGTGIAHELMETALAFAKPIYKSVYLETLDNMYAAQRFYEKHGFRRTPKLAFEAGHFACDVCYIREV